jgi:diguanylate cyclase (GGDEF)-like protein
MSVDQHPLGFSRVAAQHPWAVMFIDLDHFTNFSDEHGHPAGDEALRHVADLLRSQLRPEDLVCRFGGEEFAALVAAAPGMQSSWRNGYGRRLLLNRLRPARG